MYLFTEIRGSYATLSMRREGGLYIRHLVLCRVLVLFFLAVGHGFGQTGIPDTPAGRTLRAWLDACNSGDRAKVEAYAQTFNPAESVERMLALHNETGGFQLLAIESSEPLSITFRVKERASSRIGIGSLRMNDAEPPVVQTFELRPIPPGAVVAFPALRCL